MNIKNALEKNFASWLVFLRWILEEPAYGEHTFVFKDRFHAGRIPSEKLRKYIGKGNIVLLAVPTGSRS